MNLRRLRIGEWIAALSGAVLIASLLLPWWSLPGTWPGPPAEAAYLDRSRGATEWSAWEVLSAMDVLLALLGAAAVVVVVVTARAGAAGPGVAADALLSPFALGMSIACLLRVLDMPAALEAPPGFGSASVEYGAWVGLAATLCVLVGVLVAMRDERLSRPERPTDQTGVPVTAPPPVETLPGPPPA